MILVCTSQKKEFLAAAEVFELGTIIRSVKILVSREKKIVLLFSGSREDSINASIDDCLGQYHSVSLLVDSGCCGSLGPESSNGFMVAGGDIVDCNGMVLSKRSGQPDLLNLGLPEKKVLFAPQPITQKSVRDQLKAVSGAAVCNMEVLMLKKRAESLNLPFCSYRVVTDQCDRKFDKGYTVSAYPHLLNLYRKISIGLSDFR